MYDNRPSRNEDLELIKELEEQCKDKDAQLKKAAEDMKFYKLELINREDNYNKMFGSKPVIGVYNPLKEKVSVNINYRKKKQIHQRKAMQQLEKRRNNITFYLFNSYISAP